MPGKFFRTGLVCLLFFLQIPAISQAEVTKDPHVDSICVNQSITFSFTGVWGAGSRWQVPGQADKSSSSFSTSWSNAGVKNVTARVKNSPDAGTYPISITIVAHPTGPTLNTKTPAGTPCEGELLSATFNSGSGGVGCSDEYRYATRTGAVWSSYFTYTSGQQLTTGGIDEVVIEGRRSNCAATAGCTASAWTQLAQWTITNDATSPVITTCAAAKSYFAGVTCLVPVPDLTGEVVATDNCDPAPVVTQSPVAGTLIGEGVTTVTLTVTDAGSNTATCTADITVTDIIAPTFTAPANITIYSNASCVYDAGVSATGDVTDEADNCGVGEATFVDATDASDPCSIVITRTWSLVDDVGNSASDQVQTITVEDNIPPTFTVPADITVHRDASCAYDASIAVTGDVSDESDNCSVALDATYSDVVDNTDPCNVVITRTWSLTDDCGNSIDVIQLITVDDDIDPTASNPAGVSVQCIGDVPASDITVVIDEADNCTVNPVVAFVGDVSDGLTCPETITRTYSVTDDCGNSIDVIQLITVQDNIAPAITGCPANINIVADTSYCGVEVSWTAPTASDNCPGVVLTSTHNPGDIFPVGTTTVTYTATDACGLTDLCTFDVIVGTVTPPVISGLTSVCTPIQETYSVTDPGSHTFLWTVTNGTISGSDTNPLVTIDWTGTTQGVVDVTITSGSGCTNSNNLTVDKYATPTMGNINSSNSLTRR